MNIGLPVVDSLNISAFSVTLNKQYLVNSYKLYWFWGILEEVKKGNNEINFRTIVSRMVVKSWFTLLQYKLHFGVQDKLYLLVNNIFSSNSGLTIKSHPDDIFKYVEQTKDLDILKEITNFYNYVPYRFLTPFYQNKLNGIPDAKRNDEIKKLSNTEPQFYRITDEIIIIEKDWFDYLFNNQAIVEGWLMHKLISFLQSRNPNVPAIIEKIYFPQRQSLVKFANYWKPVIQDLKLKNIYDGNYLEINDLSIDHFIPWSFVHHDKIWNLVPISNSVNSMKSDKLPDLKKHLDKFTQIQFETLKYYLSKNKHTKVLEDYNLLGNIELHKNLPYELFKDTLEAAIIPLYQLAKNQGFPLWDSQSLTG